MVKVPNKLVIFGAVAAAALLVPGMLSPFMLQEAQAEHRETHQDRFEATNQARDSLVNVQAAVNAKVDADVENNNVCVVVIGGCEGNQ
jgi:hypothetical protein